VPDPAPAPAHFPLGMADPRRSIGRRTFDFSRQVAVMAIINRTPDSFHDRGRTFELSKAVAAVEQAVEDEADWVDVGGVPFGPGPEVTEAEELDRVLPVIEAARVCTDAVLSVDTFRPEVARRVLAAGADVINNATGLHDPELADAVAETGGCLIIAHSVSQPRVPVRRPDYKDVTRDVVEFLGKRAREAAGRGVPEDRIIIDPGHDLNKNTYHSLELTRRLHEISALSYPVLVSVSNKDFIGETLDRVQGDRLEGTLAAVVVSVLQGARIVRVHDVRAVVAAVRTTEAILGWRAPVAPRHNMT
jgi:dihydropteroate synthase